MPKKIIDYSKTIIYKIVCNDLTITEVYVGHTKILLIGKHYINQFVIILIQKVIN